MVTNVFDRETLLDLTVNVIPLFIILFFLVLFTLVRPFPPDPFSFVIMVGLHVVPLVSLAVLTYYSGKAIAESEARMEEVSAQAGEEQPLESGSGPEGAPDATESNAESAVEPADDTS